MEEIKESLPGYDALTKMPLFWLSVQLQCYLYYLKQKSPKVLATFFLSLPFLLFSPLSPSLLFLFVSFPFFPSDMRADRMPSPLIDADHTMAHEEHVKSNEKTHRIILHSVLDK